jgi:TerD domain
VGVTLTKGGTFALTKQVGAAGLDAVNVGLGWDAHSTDGTDFDLDACAIGVKADGKVLSDKHFVFYLNLASPEEFFNSYTRTPRWSYGCVTATPRRPDTSAVVHACPKARPPGLLRGGVCQGRGWALPAEQCLCSSQITEWRKLRDAGVLAGKSAGAKVGRPNADQAEIARLRRQLELAQRRLSKTEAALISSERLTRSWRTSSRARRISPRLRSVDEHLSGAAGRRHHY